MNLLEIQDLHAEVEGKPILKGIDLTMDFGEVHAIMGPNGSGKSTLAHVLAGREGYQVTRGTVRFMGKDLLAMSIEERAHAGLFLAMQYPVELPGVNNTEFLRTALNAHRAARGEPPLDAVSFLRQLRGLLEQLKLDDRLLKRDVNSGFSGGEKKRNEILQMEMLKPELIILDEIDSGLDIDALKAVAEGINRMKDGKRSFIIITHYSRILDYVHPDFIHVLQDGKIVKTGGPELVKTLEAEGYKGIKETT